MSIEIRTFDREDFGIVPIETTFDFVDSETVRPLYVVLNDDTPKK